MKLGKNLTIVLSLSLVLLVGCVEPNQLEKLGLITAVGYDYEEEEKKDEIKGTAVLHTFDPQMNNITNIIDDVGKTSKGIRQKQNVKSSNKLVSGQLRVAVYGEEVAKEGISPLVDTLNRDATIGNLVYLSVAKGRAEDLLKKNTIEQSQNLGTYLYQLIKQNVEGELIMSPTLYEYNHSYFDIGKDPVLPVLELDGGDIVISGLGIFKNDKYVEEYNKDHLFYLKVLIDEYKAGALELEFPVEELKEHIVDETKAGESVVLTIDNINSRRKIEVTDIKQPKFKVVVDLETRILEISKRMDLGNPAVIKAIRAVTEKEIQKKMEEMIQHFQEIEVDPIGFGNKYEAKYRGKTLKKDEWRELLKNAEFDIKINNTIVRTGVID